MRDSFRRFRRPSYHGPIWGGWGYENCRNLARSRLVSKTAPKSAALSRLSSRKPTRATGVSKPHSFRTATLPVNGTRSIRNSQGRASFRHADYPNAPVLSGPSCQLPRSRALDSRVERASGCDNLRCHGRNRYYQSGCRPGSPAQSGSPPAPACRRQGFVLACAGKLGRPGPLLSRSA